MYDRNGVNFQDVFYNLTLSYQSAKVNKYFVTISGQISSLDGFNELLNDHDNKLFSYNFPPIESVSFAEEVKCFTFFSALQIPYKNYQAKLSSIKINKDFPKNWFPYDRENKMMIAIHSPLVIPARSSFFSIEPRTENTIYISKIENIQLINYDECQVYGIKKQDKFKMRSDCLHDCFISKFNEKDQNTLAKLRNTLLRGDQLSNLTYEGYNYQLKFNFTIIRDLCLKACKEDCYQEYYLQDIKTKYQQFGNVLHSTVYINVEANSMPNVIIEHFAEMTFLSLLCNFGGLIGMWLGTSLLSLSCDIWKFTKQYFMKFIFKIKLNTTHNNSFFIVNNRMKNHSLVTRCKQPGIITKHSKI